MADDRHLRPLKGDQDVPYIDVRLSSDGTVANAETVIQAPSTGQLVDGLINVMGAKSIGIYARGDYGTGPLTAITLFPIFGGDGVTATFRPMLLLPTAVLGIITLEQLGFALNDGEKASFVVSNPGASHMLFRVTSAGTVTGSDLALSICRFKWNAQQLLDQT